MPLTFKRLFKLGKLYHKFIKGSQLERQGWRSEHVARLLQAHGFIKLVTTQTQDTKGRFSNGVPKYFECEGKAISRQQFFKLFAETLRAGAIGEDFLPKRK